ncbi:MAG: TonB family protein [Candidatus Omnitrophica bacterium]|nr:TonB family protein [Candidatus Omnitrophota bacterium]
MKPAHAPKAAHRPLDPDEMADRVFMAAFALSLGAHLILLIGQFLSIPWLPMPRTHKPLEVIYEQPTAQEALRQLQEQLARTKRETASSPSPAPASDRTQIRIPDRPSLTAGQALADIMPDRSAMVDLTNLIDAAGGDPVLLSYFSAIREQIQRTANHQAWVHEQFDEGLIFVTFVLSASGAVQGVQVAADRSVPSAVLRDVAVRIVKAAAPFPPFPPSIAEANKTIIVPLEFLLGG